MNAKRLLTTIEWKGRTQHSCSYMAAVLHFRPDLALVKEDDIMRSQVLTGAL